MGNTMRSWQLSRFGIDHLEQVDAAVPVPGPGEARIRVRAMSLNYRDLAIVDGSYNPRLALPVVPLSDAAGVVNAVGEGVTRVRVGDRVMTHFVAGWIDGPYRGEYLRTTLGTPGPGVASEECVVPAAALLPLPSNFDSSGSTAGFAAASTLPIAALTAWSALVTEGRLTGGGTVLTLGTGGVSVFALQIGAALGARVLVTSSDDARLARAAELGASAGINYRKEPDWHKRVLALTEGRGVDVVVETGGIDTIGKSLLAVRPGGVVALMGSLTGMQGELNLALVMMRRIRLQGILVDSRAAFAELVALVARTDLRPVIAARYRFDELPAALSRLQAGGNFGKVVVEVD